MKHVYLETVKVLQLKKVLVKEQSLLNTSLNGKTLNKFHIEKAVSEESHIM